MKLDIQSAQNQVFGVNEVMTIDSLAKLSIEMENLNNIIESLDGDNYTDTRFNLEVIVEDKLDEGLSLILEKLTSSNSMKMENNIDRNFFMSFFTKYMPIMQRHYEKFSKAKGQIVTNMAAANSKDKGKITMLLNNIDDSLGKYKDAYDKLDKTGFWRKVWVILRALIIAGEVIKMGTIISIVSAMGGPILTGAGIAFGAALPTFVILFLLSGIGFDKRWKKKLVLDDSNSRYQNIIKNVISLSNVTHSKTLISGLEKILSDSNKGVKAVDGAMQKLLKQNAEY